MKILRYPNKHLVHKTVDVNLPEIEDSNIETLALTMIHTLNSSTNGLALAANQVGLPWRFFVIKDSLANEYGIPTAIFNPKLRQFGESKIEMQEGCLSFPGIFLKIKRPEMVVCEYDKLSGEHAVVTLEDLGARVFQHEVEHLDGKLFVDNVDRITKYQVFGRMRKL